MQIFHKLKKIKKYFIKKKINLSLIFEKKSGIELISHKFLNEKQILQILFKNKIYEFKLN